MEWIKSIHCTLRPASLLWRFMAARASWPVSKASTNCLEMASPKTTLSLQPPQSHPWPPGRMKKNKKWSKLFVLQKYVKMGLSFISNCCGYFSYLVVHFCCHHSRSCQSLQDCSSWLKCTWLPRSWWHEQTQSPDLLSTERPISQLVPSHKPLTVSLELHTVPTYYSVSTVTCLIGFYSHIEPHCSCIKGLENFSCD